jgi:hypothetical protein
LNLADVYSYLESLRRGTKGLLANPSDTLNQWGSQIKEDLGKYDQGNARTMGLLSDPVLGGGSAPGVSAWQNNGPLGSGLLGALHIAYHGTPHTVDKFDMSKVGTGEGAQAYGHGLYFAENPQTAGVYRDALSPFEVKTPTGSIQKNFGTVSGPEREALSFVEMAHKNGEANPFSAATNYLKDFGNNMDPSVVPYYKKVADALQNWQAQGATAGKSGNLYKVDINADPAHYLDWDKPLSEQSQRVQDAIAQATPAMSPVWQKAITPQTTGQSLYQAAGSAANNPQEATTLLRQLGIPGIKYKDAGSRSGDGGTHNYVVFDDSLINNLGPWQP